MPASSPIDLYKEFIDGLVASRGSMSYLASVPERAEPPKGSEYAALFNRYSPEQFRLLARFIGNLRSTAFHDFLVFLHDSEYRLSRDGQPLAVTPFGNPPHYDFVGRQDGASWDDLGWSGTTSDESKSGNA